MNILVLNKQYAIYKFRQVSDIPGWLSASDFYSITRTKDEVSVVAFQNDSVSHDIICNNRWRIFKIVGPLDFSLIGIIAEISSILSAIKIPIFALSTFDTDYFLVRQAYLDLAIDALQIKGHTISIDY